MTTTCRHHKHSCSRHLRCPAGLRTCAIHLLGAGRLLARFPLDRAGRLLDCALGLVLESGLRLALCTRSSLLGHAARGLGFGSAGLGGSAGRVALARRFGGDGVEHSRPRVASRAAGLGHFVAGGLRKLWKIGRLFCIMARRQHCLVQRGYLAGLGSVGDGAR